MHHQNIERRQFLNVSMIGATAALYPFNRVVGADAKTAEPLRFGVIADVHKDVMHDADQRLQVFTDGMNKRQVDFVLQLGDFCIPTTENLGFLKIWNSFLGPRYHVLGNHDTDGNETDHPERFEREQTVEYWGMEGRYYSFNQKRVHVVVLDGNDQGPGQKPYYRWVADDQLDWFAEDLASTSLPTLVFVHQSPERSEKGGIENGKSVQMVMEDANRKVGRQKVIACFSGHHHRDYMRRIGSVLYSQINSASYYWIGSKYQQVRYSPEIDKSHPYIKYTVPYKESLFAIVTVDLANGILAIEGRSTEFVGPSPWEMGASREELEAPTLVPRISDWRTPV
jgi:predicted phosphodiesterase